MASVLSNKPVWRFLLGACLIPSLAASQAFAAEKPKSPPLRVEEDMRVELMSIIFRLAGNPEYSQGKVESYAQDVESHFGRFRDHEAVHAAKSLRASRGISYDAVMSMAMHIQDAEGLRECIPLKPRPESLDERWQPDEARDFLQKARRFVKDSGFAGFMEARKPLFKLTADRLRTLLGEKGHLEWFNEFFGNRPGAAFLATFGMLNGGCCYGPRVRLPDKTEALVCVLGVWKTDGNGKPDFDDSVLDTVVHEFCHSYVNPAVDGNWSLLEKPLSLIFPYVAEAMKKQAYGSPLTVMRESAVRACVVRYVLRCSGTDAAEKQIRSEISRSFLWTRELSDMLGEYETRRKEYRSFDAFIPKIAEFFESYAPKFVKERGELDAKRPKVVSSTPANGASGVDPGLDRITVVFDRPMKNGVWSMVGGGPHFPEIIGKPSYDESRRTWSVQVKLKPDWDYEFSLNSGKFQAFQSEEGVPLEPVRVKFRTGQK